ncbi:bifunctional arginine demethylase and lysyl-hydroxylase JMJD6-like [Tubulanus polymorphus]|uniref:bifunctional arginine demethylase and lysyl-hydroxylase JMJD6-like n=1 Tax=Tubulanus polymorphus TaxID=672921 RepID=UPI003DA51F58
MQKIKKQNRDERIRQRELQKRRKLNQSAGNSAGDGTSDAANKMPANGRKRKRTEAEKEELRAIRKERYVKAWIILIVAVIGFFLIPPISILIKVAADKIENYGNNFTYEPYVFDFNEVLKTREENMRKYTYLYNVDGIDKRQKLSLREFNDVYDGKWPVIVTDVMPKWQAFKRWNKKFFLDNYGDERIAVKAVAGDLDKAESLAMPMKLFLQHSGEGRNSSWTYIEDELFLPNRRELYNDMGQIIYMLDDYFELFPKDIRPWNAMLLWGTAFSRSSLHIDPYNWTGTNAVFKGRKRWKLYPPGQDEYLYPVEGRKSNFPLDCYKYNSPIDAFGFIDPNKYRKFKKAKAIEFDQLPGELLFIPTGWYHQAFNVEETVAVSSQFMNVNNFKVVLEEIFKAGNLPRDRLPPNFDRISPEQQVRVVMQKLPSKILKRGRELNKDLNEQMKHPPESKRYKGKVMHEEF